MRRPQPRCGPRRHAKSASTPNWSPPTNGETNWAATQAYLERLQVRINRMPESGAARPAVARIAIPIMFFAILVALVAAAPFGAIIELSPLAFVYFAIAILLGRGAWALVRLARRAIRARHVEELRTLARSRDRGCGAAGCRRCYRSA